MIMKNRLIRARNVSHSLNYCNNKKIELFPIMFTCYYCDHNFQILLANLIFQWETQSKIISFGTTLH